jgi:hypothetical protein
MLKRREKQVNDEKKGIFFTLTGDEEPFKIPIYLYYFEKVEEKTNEKE